MKEFLSAAPPLVLAGIALAVLAAKFGTKEHRSQVSAANIAMGAGLGLLLGVTLIFSHIYRMKNRLQPDSALRL